MTQGSVSRRVLVADDEEEVCRHLRQYLERRGFTVVVALDGSEAKRSIEKEAFDYILLDCSMPDVTGLELIGLARQHHPRAKIVMISSFPSVDTEVVQKLGGDLFIHKPLRMSEMDQIFL
jgi:DNA-binding response OmpR family regulator